MPALLEPKDRELLARYGHLPIIDTSTRRTAKKCLRLWDLTSSMRQGLRPKLPIPALMFGTLIHDALDYGYAHPRISPPAGVDGQPEYHGYDYDAMVTTFADACTREIDRIHEEYKPWGDELAKYDAMYDLGVAMLSAYAEWAPEQDDFEVVVTERAGFVPILVNNIAEDPTVPYEDYDDEHAIIGLYYFRFDGIVRDNRGRLWLMEHKTCNGWWDDTRLALDEQISAYVGCAETWYGEPIAGTLMNFLLKEALRDVPILKSGLPTTDMRKLAYVTAERYRAALAQVGDGQVSAPQETLDTYYKLEDRDKEAGHPTLRRVKVERSPHQIARQRERIAAELLELTRPDLPITITEGFMCGKCSVRDLCVQMEQGEDWQTTAKLLYERVPAMWDTHRAEEE